GGALRIARGAIDAMIAHARREHPGECCGFLVGLDDHVDEAIAAENLSGNPRRFFINPKNHIDVRREARRAGLGVLGFYHSHPNAPAWPSPADISEAAYPEALYAIVSVAADDRVDLRLCRIDHGAFIEVPITRRP